MKRGAYDYLLKPVEFEELCRVVERALEISRMSRVPTLFDTESTAGADVIIGCSPGMQEVYKAIGRVAPQDMNVLIVGETGTGKEIVARAIYQHSRRSKGPFLAINCAALPTTLLESELFGHERGSFTGAERRRVGKFEQVDGGTIFLDEIGDMPLAAQANVLRLLQEGTFERVGSNETIRVDVRVIAATNQRLEEMVKAGEFREDLFYRLSVFTIQLPPLRDRTDDIPLLVEHFVKTHNHAECDRVWSISSATMQTLRQYHWPGNVRELQSAVKYALAHSVGNVLAVDFFPESCRGSTKREDIEQSERIDVLGLTQFVRSLLADNQTDIYHRMHAEIDRILLPEVIGYAGGNQAHASQLLGIARSTLRNKIAELGLIFEKRLKIDSCPDDSMS
jgi:two-component system nitrogen regulation response regulator GlnG